MKDLEQLATVTHILGWYNATSAYTDMTQEAQLDYSAKLSNAIKEFSSQNENSKIANFYKNDNLVSEETKRDLDKKTTALDNKYMTMRTTKADVDQEYFDLFDDVVAATKQYMKEAGYTHSIQLTDSRIGEPEEVYSLVERLAHISTTFINTKPNNEIQPTPEYTVNDIHNLLGKYEDKYTYLISDKNGSFMTPIDPDTACIHLCESKGDTFDLMSSATHELGHAIYQTDFLNKYTDIGRIGGCISLSLHETASIVHELVLTGIDGQVTNGYHNIKRLTADKVHYIIHIFLRMKIEKMLFNDEITAKDIPNVWNSLSKSMLGLEPKNDWDGFLQDVHWSGGAFGYFHSYAIGFFNAMLMKQKIDNKALNDQDQLLTVISEEIHNRYGTLDEEVIDIISLTHSDIEQSIREYAEAIWSNFTYKTVD